MEQTRVPSKSSGIAKTEIRNKLLFVIDKKKLQSLKKEVKE